MALINLTHLRRLCSETETNRLLIRTLCLTPKDDENSPMTDSLFVSMMRTYKQGDNLLFQLEKLYKIVCDFSEDKLEEYADDWEGIALDCEVPIGAYDPYNELLYTAYGTGSITDLPEIIEQYADLKAYTVGFATYAQQKSKGYDTFLGPVRNIYSFFSEGGTPIYVDEADLTSEQAEIVRKRAIEREIKYTQAEYALEGYNEFYQAWRGVFTTYPDDYKACAVAIKALFTE